MFGCEPVLDYFCTLRERLQEVHELARQALTEAGARQKWAYNTRGPRRGLQPADQVWVLSARRGFLLN